MGLKAQEGKYESKVGSEVGRDTGGQRNRRQSRARVPGEGVGPGEDGAGCLGCGDPTRAREGPGSRGLGEARGSRGIARC